METIGLRHFTVDEYHRMAAAGILGEDDRVELIHGVIREMSPKKRPHVLATIAIRELFARGLTGGASVYEEKPLRLVALDSEPEPDVVVCSNPDPMAYGTDRTEPLLVIEVADSTVRYDLTIKAELYALAEIPEYWVVDLVHRSLVVLRDPKEGAFQSRSSYEAGDRIASRPSPGPTSRSKCARCYLPRLPLPPSGVASRSCLSSFSRSLGALLASRARRCVGFRVRPGTGTTPRSSARRRPSSPRRGSRPR